MNHPKTVWKPGTLLAPVPVVLVSCGRPGARPNLITVAWVGTVCSEPPMVSISIRPERHSHDIIRDTGEFVVNLPGADQAWAVDWCGVVSGRDTDKFAGAKLTPAPAHRLQGAPIVAECPLALECRVRQTLAPGSHTVFVAEVVSVQVESALERPGGRFALEQSGLLSYAHGHYYVLGRQVGHFGFSVRKKPAGKGGAGQAGRSAPPPAGGRIRG
ncbi:MAG: flavin reductase family protein [Lentisphaeria bacterium]